MIHAANHVYWLRTAERPDVDQYLREVAALGVRSVFVGGHGVADIRLGAEVTVSMLKTAMAGTGVSIHTIHALFGDERNLGVADEAARAAGIRAHEKTLRVAADLGASNVVFHIGGAEPDVNLSSALRSVETLLAVAEDAGVDVAIENLPPGLLGSSPEDLVAIMEAFDSPRLGVCLDTGHAHMTGGCDRWLDAVGPHVSMVHLHDNMGDVDNHLAPGEGTIDWPRAQRRLRENGYSGPWVSESRVHPGWTPERLFERFRTVFG
jgi:sugar phosphate isomerase/epimerase